MQGTIPNCLYDQPISEFTLANNYYNFEELAYAKSKGTSSYKYSPQFLEFVDTVYVQPNGLMDLSVDDGNYQGSQSTYRWKKDGTWLHTSAPSQEVLSINCNSSACEGWYHLEITNPDFPGMTLSGDVYYVKIRPQLNKTICKLDVAFPTKISLGNRPDLGNIAL